MFSIRGFIILTVISASLIDTGNSSKNATLEDIPIKAILKDIKELTSAKGDPNRDSSKLELKRSVVGVKKHKNYEIVLYEYSDEEDVRLNADKKDADFETNSPSLTQRTNESNSSESNKKGPTPTGDDVFAPTNRTSVPPIVIKRGKLSVFEQNSNRQNSSKQYVVANGQLSHEATQLVRSTDSEDVEAENVNDEHDDIPFVWGQREGLRSGKRRHKILLRGRTPASSTAQYEDDSDEYQSSASPEREEEDGNQSVYVNSKKTQRPQTSVPKTSITSTKRPNPRKFVVEDAPGAGRWIPRRKPTGFYGSHLIGLNKSKTVVDDQENEEDREDRDEYEDDENDGVNFCKDPTGKTGICEEYFKCSVLYTESAGRINLQDYKCALGNEIGICCPLFEERDGRGQQGLGRSMMRSLMKANDTRKPLSRQIKKLIRSNVNNSIAFGSDSVAQLDEIEQDLFIRGGEVSKGLPAFGHNRFFPSSKKIRQVSEFGFESSNTRAINDRCPRSTPCGINKYRLVDGSCNNLRRQKMGQSLTPLSRVLEPAYADGRWEPRISVRGFLLPSARLLSQRFIQDRDNQNNKYTLFVMQFGQFVDHDISSVPIFTFTNGTGISCCRNGNFLPPQDRHPNCLPIEIPADDPFYSQFGQRCMNFVRSRMAPRIDCSLGYADQMNAVTHWLDLSNVYGSSETELRELRLFEGGLLQFSELADRRPLLPLKRKNNGEIDYKAGDDRVNEMQGLMIMHLIWLREHNRVAVELQNINPFWSDEQLFQEARRIVIAEYEHIIYNEWLPIIIGREYMESYSILPLSRKKAFNGYDPEIDASIENAFSAAGFRMGHSLVQGLVRLINEFGQANEAVTISNHAENAVRTRAPNQIDKWIRGLAQQPIQSFDPFVTRHLNGRLFQARGGMFGMDLSALNIQRARDHGIPGYNAFRELCQTGKRAKSFEEFKDWISPEIVDEMRRIYDHPDDVDLWIGGISESPLKGALIGPTFTCIVGDQFARTKKGDRYFYDIGDQTHSFSPDQLQELRKSSMARVLCDNGDELEAIQPSVFLQSDFDFNSLVDCRRSRIPRVNLQLWANEPTP
ncbi:Chorion peroxidase [Folsomia candida]|uniref:Chorion peroxidase n=1 Tax=Folsomia candida TaxID=158441 RepID=A0A226EKI3_FOLCA|nr:Chorion peroxidase [Folsomia candida]